MTPDQSPEQKIMTSSSKESRTKPDEDKKRTTGLSKRTRTEGYWFSQKHKIQKLNPFRLIGIKRSGVMVDWQLLNITWVFNGGINHIGRIELGVDIPINEDNTLNLDEMYIGSDIRIGGDYLTNWNLKSFDNLYASLAESAYRYRPKVSIWMIGSIPGRAFKAQMGSMTTR